MKRPLLTQLHKALMLPMIFGLSIFLNSNLFGQGNVEYVDGGVEITCSCEDTDIVPADMELPPGYMVATVFFNVVAGTPPATNFVAYFADDVYDPLNINTLLPDYYPISSSSSVYDYEISVVYDASGTPSFKIGYEIASGIAFEMDVNLLQQISCRPPIVALDASGASFCRQFGGFETITAGISIAGATNFYNWEYSWTINNPDGTSTAVQQNIGITDSYQFPLSMAPGTYVVEVIADKMTPLDENCTIANSIAIEITDYSENLAITGEDSLCIGGSSIFNYFISPDEFSGSQLVNWFLKDDNGTPTSPQPAFSAIGGGGGGSFTSGLGYVGTGSGVTADFAATGLPAGQYSLCAVGDADNGCAVELDLPIAIYDPSAEGEITGECDVFCGMELEYALDINVDYDPLSVTWTAVGGTVDFAQQNPGTADVEWDDSVANPSVTVTGMTEDGCNFSLTKTINFLDGSEIEIEGDSYICATDAHIYCVNDLINNNLPFSYEWSLNGDPNHPNLLLPTSGCIGLNATGLTPGAIYTLQLDATPDGTGCDGFTTSINITIDDMEVTTMACLSSGLNVSIGNNCTLEVLPSLLIEGVTSVDNDAFTVMLTDITTGETIDGNILDESHLGHQIEVKVIQDCTGQSCWGYITVEDKSVPVAQCLPGIFDVDCEDVANNTDPLFFPDFDADVTVIAQGNGSWRLLGFDNCGPATLTFEDVNVDNDECANPSRVDRRWIITDSNGGTSVCTTRLRVSYDPDDKVVMPPNYDDIIAGAEPSLPDCPNQYVLDDDGNMILVSVNWPTDDNGNPHPSFTGYPTGAACANIEVIGYNDTELQACAEGSNSKKIIREWVIWDSCAETDIIRTQFITLMDFLPPACAAPEEFVVYSDDHECEQDIFIPYPTIFNECGSYTTVLTYKLRDDNGIIPEFFTGVGVTESPEDGGFYINDLNFGSDSLWVNFKVQDACGNLTEDCLTEVALIDGTPPNPVCDLNNNVALNDEGCAYAGPGTFDDSSYDNCGVYQTVIKRMDMGANCGGCPRPHFDFLTFLGEFNGSYYYLSDKQTTGLKALSYGRAIESPVAVVETAAENTWINEAVGDYTIDPYFIGYSSEDQANDIMTNSDFDSELGGTIASIGYDNWGAGEPAWNPEGKGNLYVVVNSDGTWDAKREQKINAYYVIEVKDPCEFSQQVKFCCADIGEETMVVTRVFDHFGNYQDCMVNVEVQDFMAPTVETGVDNPVNLDCEQLDGTDYELLENSVSLDTLFGTPIFADNCPLDIDYEVTITTETTCGAFTITRRWTATDGYGNSTTVTQRINVGNAEPFDYMDIIWPSHYDLNDCVSGTEPDELPVPYNYPTFQNVDGCSTPTASHSDQVFEYTEGACKKIIRTWTVIDWCQSGQQWNWDQVIKIYDNHGPSFTQGCSDLTGEIEGIVTANCTFETWEAGLNAKANDNCNTPNELVYHYSLDLHSDGSMDAVNVNSSNANGTYPFGTHTIYWSVQDQCGNVTECDMFFTIQEDKDPTPYCLQQVATAIPAYGTVEIWANDFDLGSFDDCGSQEDLIFSFSQNTGNTFLAFTCDDIPEGQTSVDIPLEMWVTDNDGNQSYCPVILILQANGGVCDTHDGDDDDDDDDQTYDRASIAGNVYTENQEMLEEVSVELMHSGNMMNQYMTDEGNYAFADLEVNENYEVHATKDDSYLNGVSTLDLVLIQKHILGLQALDSPYKIIAADANDSESVTGIDLVVIRKLILGIYDAYPHNTSWRFVDESFVFNDVQNPWPFNEQISVDDLDQDQMEEDFIGVKIGDVNGSAVANLLHNNTQERSVGDYKLEVKTSVTESGTAYSFYATEATQLLGLQFSIQMNLKASEIVELIPGAIAITDDNMNQVSASNEVLISWNGTKAIQLSGDESLFSFIVLHDTNEELAFTLSDGLKDEVYVEGEHGVESLNIQIDKLSSEVADFEVYQNTPNPFTNETTIGFRLPVNDNVFIQIIDNTGKVLYETNEYYQTGYNEVKISTENIPTTGILYYQISTNTHIATRKMIVLK